MVEQETTFRRLKYALLELLRGYPIYRFFGKIESYIRESNSSLEVLKKDGIIEFASKTESGELNKKLTPEQWEMLKAEGKEEPVWYRLAPRGIDLAISMINLEYSKKINAYSEQTLCYNERMEILTFAMIIFAAASTILSILALFLQSLK
ncbi:MAG: hypothetical protein PHQ66_03000 [Candidatus Nanoarchaeia archaeon]|nr:hypothetical protein [Candidatus Nanoarchaeia archaeon]MDD5357666.1 hypothetical protein [Candidatus Nanoarchaeia archaeon]MDD5588585.1 hypothetical protein [Candidatus Nanoarchaeia archaeon]